MIENSYLSSDLINTIEKITKDDLIKFKDEFLKALYIQALVIGNILEKNASALI